MYPKFISSKSAHPILPLFLKLFYTKDFDWDVYEQLAKIIFIFVPKPACIKHFYTSFF